MADVILCLGRTFRRAVHRRELELRVERAVSLWRRHRSTPILLCGGAPKRSMQTEAMYMRDCALRLGVPPRRIILEESSLTTVGNAHFANIVMHERGWHSATVVTTSYHVPRAEYIFERVVLGVELEFVGAQSPYGLTGTVWRFGVEILKLLRMRVRGVYLRRDERRRA